MNILQKIVALFIAVVMLQACGGSDKSPTYTISADVTEVSFSNEFLQAKEQSIAIKVNFEGEGLLVGFAPDSQPVGWLTYRSEDVTDNSATIYIDVVDSDRILADLYTTKIRLATGNAGATDLVFHDIDVSLLVWQLSVDTELLSYRSTLGDSVVAAQTIELTSESNEWTASTDVDWLSLDLTEGTGGASIVVTADISGFTTAGLQEGNIVLTEVTSGDTKSIPVELGIDNIYLYSDQSVVALTSTNNISVIEQTLNIANNGTSQVAWQATTTANWLTLTVLPNNQLKVTADVNAAPLDAISSADIILSATNGAIAIDDTVQVTFYNANLLTETKLIEPLSVADANIVVSPKFPYLYVAQTNELHTYHQYTGVVKTPLVVSPAGTQLEQLIIHPDGSYLLAKAVETVTNADGTTSEVTHRYRVNLIDNSITEITDATIEYEPLAIVRFSGRYFVITQTLEFADENLQQLYWDGANAFFANKVAMATQVNTLFALDSTAVSFKRFVAQVNDFSKDKVTAAQTHEYHPESLADDERISDFVVSSDGSNINLVSPSSEWISFDGTVFIDNGLLEANTTDIVTIALAMGSDNKAHYLRANRTSFAGFYIDNYTVNQTLENTILTNGNQPESLRISADNKRAILNVTQSTPRIELVNLIP